MKKVTSIRSHIIFMAVAGLVGMHNLNAITDAEIVMLVEQKKAKIKPEELVKMYQDFLASIKDEFIAYDIKRREADKQQWKAANIAANPNLSKQQILKEFEANWHPKEDAEYYFSTFGYNDPKFLSEVLQLSDPVMDFIDLVLGHKLDRPGLLGESAPEIKKYKEDYKKRLYQWLKSK